MKTFSSCPLVSLTVEKGFIVSDHLQSQQQAIKDLILENHYYHFVSVCL